MERKISVSAENGKPSKPHSGYPLYAHASGRWGKKVRGKLHFFGRWGTKSGPKVIPVDDLEASAAAALAEFNRQWPYLSQGKSVPSGEAGKQSGCTIAEICNAFLQEKQNLLDSKELSAYTFSEYFRTCRTLVSYFGKERIVAELTPADFSGFRATLAKGCGVVTILSKVNRCRVVFKFAFDAKLISTPVDFGTLFKRPKPKDLMAAKNTRDPKVFSRDELLKILAALSGQAVIVNKEPVTWPKSDVMRAMVLLGINCAFGNTDIATLTKAAVDLEAGWITFPRPKTGIQRRIPLWPETASALAAAIAQRPKPKDPADCGLCFITERGTRFLRVQESKTTEGHYVTINAISRRFEQLLIALDLNQNRGRNFYGLRHAFETVAGECEDQVAVDAIMGHSDPSMGANYRHGVSDARLLKAVGRVRQWLWPEMEQPPQKPTKKTRKQNPDQ